ncbi:MAG: Rrf2 family transcriptional regulator [Acidobacteria bacterium]|nr:Rrf2 family transcriptional regulator [Acidobacteriota bacterium]
MLSQTVGYAVTAMGWVAGSGDGPVLVRDIAAGTGIPSAYLAKIVNSLARKGFVVTQRGTKGGVALAHRPESITIYDLCAALDDPLVKERCMLGMASCSDDRRCPAHEFWKAQREKELEFLRRTTLSDVAAFEHRRTR